MSLLAGHPTSRTSSGGLPTPAINTAVARLSQATATLYSYDAMGRITTKWEQTPSTSPGGKFIYSTFDLAGNLTSTTTAAGTKISYGPYSGANRLTTITSSLVDANHPATLWSAGVYYPHGAVETSTFGNGLIESRDYEPRLQLCQLNLGTFNAVTSNCSVAPPSGLIEHYQYVYGNWGSTNNGNVTGWSGNGTQSFSRNYTYDSLNRIQSMTTVAESCTGYNWTIDAWGNMTQQAGTGGTCYTFQVAAGTNNQVTGNQYDAAGNVTYGPGSHHFTYDAENRIIQVDSGSASYVYNENGNRVRKNIGSAWTEYFYGPNGSVQSEYNGSWPFQYVYAGSNLIAQYTSSTTEFVHTDYLGSTRMVTGVNQAVADSMDYLPFGLQIAGGTTTTHKFTGKERDNESGIDNFGARYYESYIGRFMSPDPLMILKRKLVDPQQWNMYSYSRNNPLRFMDPTGMYVADCGSGVKNCDKQIQNLDKSLQNALKSKDPNVVKAAQAYGKLGDANGVNVSLVKVVDPNHPNVTGKTTEQGKTGGYTVDPATGKVQQATQVDIRAGMGGSQLEETAVHEGVHIEDRANFVNSITSPTTFDRSLNITGRQSERNAYGVENEWLQQHGMPTRDINDILARPPYSDNPNIDKPLFPNIPGPE